MSYNYLGLTNDVLGKFNEVALTSANFSTATDGSYRVIKDGINNAIRDINQVAWKWPFNFVEQEDTLSAGVLRYSYPWNTKHVDFNTFRIKRNSTFGNDTILLRQMDYEEYLEKHIDDEYNTSDTGIRRLPTHICRTPSQEYIVWPAPDNAYELVYEFYSLPVDLALYSDVPTIPEAFRHVITEGAAYYGYLFRSDYEAADRSEKNFNTSIENMRTIYINRYEDVRDTRVSRSPVTSNKMLRIS